MSSMIQRILKGVGSQALNQVWTFALRFLEIPLFLNFWPTSRYGEWLILSSFVTYLTLSDLGVSQVINRDIIIAASAGNEREASEMFETGIIFSSMIAVCTSLIFVGAIFFYDPISSHLSGLGTRFDIINMSIILAASVVLSLQLEYWLGVLASAGRYPIGLFIVTVIQVCVFVSTAGVLAYGGGAVLIALCALLCQCIGQIFVCVLALRSATWLDLKFHSFSFSRLIRLWQPTVGIFGIRLQQAVLNDLLRLIVGIVAGPALVVSYIAHARLARFLTVTTRLSYPLHVEMGLAFGGNQRKRFQQLARTNIALCGTAAFGFAIVEMAIAPVVFTEWVRNSTSFDPFLFIVLLVGSFEDVLAQLALAPLLATNRYSLPAVFTTIILIAVVPCTFLLGYAFNVIGVAFAQLGAQSAVLFILASYYKKSVGENFWTSAFRAFDSTARKQVASVILKQWRG
jgi:O-antigen/teichoic acid export membrane protein